MEGQTSVKAFMALAIEQAEIALKAGEIPVGCVFVDVNSGVIVAKGSNRTNETRNGTCHAEMNAINHLIHDYGLDISLKLLQNCHLYVTCEPCIMCAYALNIAKVKGVVFGCEMIII